jgi:hypothetical protein
MIVFGVHDKAVGIKMPFSGTIYLECKPRIAEITEEGRGLAGEDQTRLFANPHHEFNYSQLGIDEFETENDQDEGLICVGHELTPIAKFNNSSETLELPKIWQRRVQRCRFEELAKRFGLLSCDTRLTSRWLAKILNQIDEEDLDLTQKNMLSHFPIKVDRKSVWFCSDYCWGEEFRIVDGEVHNAYDEVLQPYVSFSRSDSDEKNSSSLSKLIDDLNQPVKKNELAAKLHAEFGGHPYFLSFLKLAII